MIDGWERWRRRLPGYRGARLALLPLVAVGSIVAGQLYLVALESLPLVAPHGGLVTALEPTFPVFGTLTVVLAGFLGIHQLWARRDRYLAASRETAYQRALPFGLLGTGLIFTVVLNGFVPVYQLSRDALGHPLSVALSTPIVDFLPGGEAVGWAPRAGLGLAVVGLGLVHAGQTVRTFGVDNAMLVYLYYPDESGMEHHAIYSVIRHPLYFGWLLWMAGGTLFRLSLYGVIDLLVFSLAVVVWVRRVEEPELVVRFGDEYREYRREVPAFVPRPGALGTYLAFLLGRR